MTSLKKIYPLSFIIFFSFVWVSCNPKTISSIFTNYDSLEFDQEVKIYSLEEQKPENMDQIGQLQIRDTGFTTNCSYQTVLNEAKLEARKVGGEAIKIISHKKPNFWSTCHRIDAIILKQRSNK